MADTTENTTEQKAKQLTKRQLMEAHPAVFSKPCKPLRIGVFDDLMRAHEGQISKKTLCKFMRMHTSHTGYLMGLASGGPRYALDGSKDGVITEMERENARTRITQQEAREDARGMAIRERSLTLKDFEASGLGRPEYAKKTDVTLDTLCSTLDRALMEREDRRRSRLRVVEKLEKSGLSPEEYATREHIPLSRLTRFISKVAAARAAAG